MNPLGCQQQPALHSLYSNPARLPPEDEATPAAESLPCLSEAKTLATDLAVLRHLGYGGIAICNWRIVGRPSRDWVKRLVGYLQRDCNLE